MLENHHLKITILEDHLSKLLFFITPREISIKNLIFFFVNLQIIYPFI